MTADICAGCGAPLQDQKPDAPGYLPVAARTREDAVCRRCFRIRHYGEFSQVSLGPSDYQRTVKRALAMADTVLYVIDVFDVSGSLVPNLSALMDNQRVVVVVNKVDVLPTDVDASALAKWIRVQVEHSGISVADVAAVSAQTGYGVDALQDLLLENTKQVCVVGMTNVGKSTLLNRMVAATDGESRLTMSRLPGTTVGLTEVTVAHGEGQNKVLIDTPGLITGHRATDHLCAGCLARAVPARRLRPRVFQLDSGQSLFLGGFARLDFEQGAHQPVVCYVSNDLVVHRSKLVRADDFSRHHALDLLQVPCAMCSRNFGVQQPRRVSTWQARGSADLYCPRSGCDIVLAGLGWVTLFGAPFEGTLYAPDEVELSTRPRLVGQLSRA